MTWRCWKGTKEGETAFSTTQPHERRQPIVTTSVTSTQLRRRGRARCRLDSAHLGGDRQHAQRPGLPPRLPPDRQPARRRGPHPGGLRPRLPLAVDYTPGTFEGWLHRITTNLFLDMVRRKQRIRFDALGDDAAERLPSREPSPQQVFNDTHFDADVQQALDTLAPEFRAAVVLCDIEGLSYEEIAATLGVKLGTVRCRIHRGRSQLRKALEHRSPEVVPPPARRPRSPVPARRARASGSGRRVAVTADRAGGDAVTPTPAEGRCEPTSTGRCPRRCSISMTSTSCAARCVGTPPTRSDASSPRCAPSTGVPMSLRSSLHRTRGDAAAPGAADRLERHPGPRSRTRLPYACPARAHERVPTVRPTAPPLHRSPMRAAVVASIAAGASAAAAWGLAVVSAARRSHGDGARAGRDASATPVSGPRPPGAATSTRRADRGSGCRGRRRCRAPSGPQAFAGLAAAGRGSVTVPYWLVRGRTSAVVAEVGTVRVLGPGFGTIRAMSDESTTLGAEPPRRAQPA